MASTSPVVSESGRAVTPSLRWLESKQAAAVLPLSGVGIAEDRTVVLTLLTEVTRWLSLITRTVVEVERVTLLGSGALVGRMVRRKCFSFLAGRVSGVDVSVGAARFWGCDIRAKGAVVSWQKEQW
jgi:hypothetical protein